MLGLGDSGFGLVQGIDSRGFETRGRIPDSGSVTL